MSEVLKVVEGIGTAFEQFKRMHDTRMSEFSDRIEQIESGVGRPKMAANDSVYSREQHEYKSVFTEWLRKPLDDRTKNRLSEAQHELQKKDVSIGTAAAGGYALPEQISAQIETRIETLNPFRKLVRVDPCGTNDYKALLSLGDATSGWSSETGARSATDSPTLRERAPTMGENYAVVTATNWSLQDIFFNVENWLVTEAGNRFAADEAIAIVSGNGTDKPTGFLNTTPTTLADFSSPQRSAATLQYLPYGSYTSPYTLSYKSLVDLMMSVREQFMASSQKIAWVMRRSTMAFVRKIVDTTGQPIWQPSMAAGNPPTLLGFPVYTTEAMQAMGAGNYPVAFGAWDQGYLLAERSGMSIIVDQVTTKGKTIFYISRRLGGCVYSNDAIKVLKQSVS